MSPISFGNPFHHKDRPPAFGVSFRSKSGTSQSGYIRWAIHLMGYDFDISMWRVTVFHTWTRSTTTIQGYGDGQSKLKERYARYTCPQKSSTD